MWSRKVPRSLLISTPQYRPLESQPVLYDGASGDGIDGSASSGQKLLTADEKIRELSKAVQTTQSETERLTKVRLPSYSALQLDPALLSLLPPRYPFPLFPFSPFVHPSFPLPSFSFHLAFR